MNTLLADIGYLARHNATEKGFDSLDPSDWYGHKYKVPTRLVLIHSEVSEALEAYREPGDGIGPFSEELADIIIRTCELAAGLGIDLDQHVEWKMTKNRGRPHKHGGKRI